MQFIIGRLKQSLELFDILKSVIALFACTNLYDIFNIVNEYLTVADMTGVKNLLSGLNNLRYGNLAYNYVNLNLR